MRRKCRYCGHNEPADLIEVTDDDWGHLYFECADCLLCELRIGVKADGVPGPVVEQAKRVFPGGVEG
jgi:hypothetical protein